MIEIILEILKTAWFLYLDWWWLVNPPILFWIFITLWMNYIQRKYLAELEWSLLEVRLPREIEKGPKTAEQMLAGMWSIYDSAIDTLYDIYLEGVVDYYFSLEIASFAGDVHFYIRTPKTLRDFTEAQIYAQYPEAEIVEVEDYVKNVPRNLPNKDYDLWGTEMLLSKEDAYPIMTYSQFEDKPTGTLVDPVSVAVEELGKLQEGEQTWIQILIRPTGDEWKEEGRELVAKLIGKKVKKSPSNILQMLSQEIGDFGRYLVSAVTFRPPEASSLKAEEGAEAPESLMLYLSPGEREVVEAVEKNIAKPGFEVKIRWTYIAKRDKFFKPRGVSGVMGIFSQFKTVNLNSFIPDSRTKTSAYYFLTEFRKTWRKREIFRNYRERAFWENGFVLNTEELATVFHFPTITTKAPMVSRVEARKGEPPATLPVE